MNFSRPIGQTLLEKNSRSIKSTIFVPGLSTSLNRFHRVDLKWTDLKWWCYEGHTVVGSVSGRDRVDLFRIVGFPGTFVKEDMESRVDFTSWDLTDTTSIHIFLGSPFNLL